MRVYRFVAPLDAPADALVRSFLDVFGPQVAPLVERGIEQLRRSGSLELSFTIEPDSELGRGLGLTRPASALVRIRQLFYPLPPDADPENPPPPEPYAWGAEIAIEPAPARALIEDYFRSKGADDSWTTRSGRTVPAKRNPYGVRLVEPETPEVVFPQWEPPQVVAEPPPAEGGA